MPEQSTNHISLQKNQAKLLCRVTHCVCVCVLCKVVHACSHAMYIYIPSNEQRHSDPECFDAILQKCSSLATRVGQNPWCQRYRIWIFVYLLSTIVACMETSTITCTQGIVYYYYNTELHRELEANYITACIRISTLSNSNSLQNHNVCNVLTQKQHQFAKHFIYADT